jgi:hypothetical protein
MSKKRVHIRELAGWDLDSYEYRRTIAEDKLVRARALVAQRPAFEQVCPLLTAESYTLKDLFDLHAQRADLVEEMSGLSWSLGLVDLRSLIAFQRRLFFPYGFFLPPVPSANDWPALMAHSFATAKPPEFERTHDQSSQTLIFRSENPNMHFRVTNDTTFPITVHTGSPFFEIASFRGRWFLRDGYHRAFALLRAGVQHVPAVIAHATTIDQLGAAQSWFFPETILFSERPPLVTDFLEDNLVVEYDRPRLIKSLRLTIEDTLTPEGT